MRARCGWPRLALALAAGVWVEASARAAAVEVAVVKSGGSATWRPAVEALRKAARGHVLTEYELPEDSAQAQLLVAGLRGRAAVLVAMGPRAAQLVREALPDLPLVFCMVQDPARAGLAPAPHVAGVLFEVPVRNQLAAFRLVNPRGVRIGILYSPENTGRQVEEAQRAASVLRLIVMARPVATEGDVPGALRALLSGEEPVDALWFPPDPLLMAEAPRRFLLAEMRKAGKPVYGFSSALVPEGALASDGPDFASIGEEVASLVSRLAAGERNLELRAPRAELVVNMRVAARLKIEIPEEALKAARKY